MHTYFTARFLLMGNMEPSKEHQLWSQKTWVQLKTTTTKENMEPFTCGWCDLGQGRDGVKIPESLSNPFCSTGVVTKLNESCANVWGITQV